MTATIWAAFTGLGVIAALFLAKGIRSSLTVFLSRRQGLHIVMHDREKRPFRYSERRRRYAAQLLAGLKGQQGSILWNPPERMKAGRKEVIEVRLGDATVAEAALRDGLRGRGTPNVDHLELAPTMRVVLVSDPKDFSIQDLSSKDQYVRSGQVVRWDFDVTPLRSGNRRLRLLASMRVRVEGKDEVVDLPSYEREVRVAVAPVRAIGRFFDKYWRWVAGTVAIPFVVWIAKDTGVAKAVIKQLQSWFGTE